MSSHSLFKGCCTIDSCHLLSATHCPFEKQFILCLRKAYCPCFNEFKFKSVHLLSVWNPLRQILMKAINCWYDSVDSLDKSSCPRCDTWTLSAKANPDKSLCISGQDPKKDKRTCLLCTDAWLTLILCYFWDILDRYFGCLKQSLDKQTIRARLTWPCVPSAPLTVRLTINPQNESKGMMADMFIGCICCLQIPGPRQ